jgi:Co/Zn/Cd efflux system component
MCTRNDVLGNIAVLIAAAGVFGTGTGWPDVIVATIMAVLALQGAYTVIRQSVAEWRSDQRLVQLKFPLQGTQSDIVADGRKWQTRRTCGRFLLLE